jgi:hypothetical protein
MLPTCVRILASSSFSSGEIYEPRYTYRFGEFQSGVETAQDSGAFCFKAWAGEHNLRIEWENMYAHRCQVCIRL